MDKENQFRVIHDYLTEFVSNIRENDPLPVRAPSYEVSESEIDGQILDIVYHYLNQRECHPYIRNLVAHRVWTGLRNSENADDTDGLMHSKQPFYDSMKLIRDVTNSANDTIKEILCTLSPAVTDNVPHYLSISHYCIKNTRRKMEDRLIILQDLNTLYDMKFGYPHAYYGVFDGHCGPDGAVYAAAHLHQFLIQNPLYITNLEAALKHAFHICDTNFIRHAKTERLKGGTTAVVALVRENRLVVAWLGDSQALLVRKRKAAHVGEPHTPNRECERKRIDDMGGAVLDIGGTWRVLGQLAVSRAIGDADYKPYISSECDIKSLEISGDEDFLILACDGLWDTLSPKEAVNLVYAYLTQNDGDTEGVGKCLVEAARLAGSEDNITAVVVFLRPVTTLMEEEAIRVENGEVTDVGQVIPVKKDSQPNFMTNLFSQPPITFGKVENNFTASQLPTGEPPFEEPAPDYDMDIVAESEVPTTEEVHAVLAEFDSLPDAPEDNDESSDEGEWTYAKVEPRTHTQMDDILPDTMLTQDEEVHSITEPTQLFNIELAGELVAVPKPSSPQFVEGFVTSVELNAEQNIYPEFNVNQSPERSLERIEQVSSGPFSVYVSSSPEPASIDAVVLAQSPINFVAPKDVATNGEREDNPSGVSVEIVHAQSTIEVMPNQESVDEQAYSTEMKIPDIMTQSFSGEIPTFPYNLLTFDSADLHQPMEEVLLYQQVHSDRLDILDPIAENSVEVVAGEPNVVPFGYESFNILNASPKQQEFEHFTTIESNLSNLVGDFEENGEISPIEETVGDVPCSQVTGTVFKEEPTTESPSVCDSVDEEKPDLAEKEQYAIFTENNFSDLISTNDNALVEEVESASLKDEADMPPVNNLVSEIEDILVEPTAPIDDPREIVSKIHVSTLTDDPRESVRKINAPTSLTEIKEAAPIKKVAPSMQLKKTVKDARKPTSLAATTAKPERTTALKKPTALRELAAKPTLVKKDISTIKKAPTSRTITKSATLKPTSTSPGVAKSTTTTAAAMKPLSTSNKSPLRTTTKPAASSIAERATKKPAPSGLASKSKLTDKCPTPTATAKITTGTTGSSVMAVRRSLTTPRPTVASSARTSAINSARSAAFAAPTKDSKNTTNKLLSSKNATGSVTNRVPKLVNKPVAPTNQKRVITNRPTTGMKPKEKASPKMKSKEIVTNGSTKNAEKESCVEKTEDVKEDKNVVINANPS